MANKTVSIIPSGNNQYLTTSAQFNGPVTDSVSAGVIGAITATSGVAPMTGAFAVNAQGTPNMTVAVTGPAVGYVAATPSGSSAQIFRVAMDVSENVTIGSNSTGSTVYDFLYLKLDSSLLNNPDSADTTVASLVTSRSTTPYSPGATANGNSNGVQANMLLLAVVTVVNNATSIGNSSITDARVLATDTIPQGTAGDWIPELSASWVYVSATSMTVPAATAAAMDKGTRIRLVQTTIKYFVVTSVSGTTINFTGGSDYTLANATIGSAYFSNAASPQGYPQWFNYTPTLVGWTTPPTGAVYRFSTIGRQVTVIVSQAGATGLTSNSTALTITPPILPAALATEYWGTTPWNITDNGVGLTTAGRAFMNGGSTVISCSKDQTGSTWAAAGNKSISFILVYEI